MNPTELGFLLALMRYPKFGATRLAQLRNRFSTMEEAFTAPREELLASGLPPKVVEGFLAERPNLNPAKELERLKQTGADVIPFTDPRYPPLLKQIYDPPAALFVRGTLPDHTRPHLAVVGSRKHTHYGTRAVEELIPSVAAHAVIVSGLALGIDALAHKATLEANGTTIAVLGSGVDDDNIYPSQNRALASHILATGGAIISEFPLGTHPLKQHFPIRNRIIAGLCHGTLVVEAAKKSGTLITARLALEHNRDVFSIPGSIYSPLSVGANALIKDGAIPVTQPEDILDALGLQAERIAAESYSPDTPEAQKIFDQLGSEPLHIDELARLISLSAGDISRTLTMMELAGGVRHAGGQYYTRG